MTPKLDALLYRLSVQADKAARWQKRGGQVAVGAFWGILAVPGAIAAARALDFAPQPAVAGALLAIGTVAGIGGAVVEIVALRRRLRFEARAGATVERAILRAWNRAVRASEGGSEGGHGRYLH